MRDFEDDPVSVREVTGSVEALVATLFPSKPVLGDAHSPEVARIEEKIQDLTADLRVGNRVFLLNWEGSKVPRGAKVLDYVISWTQNGVVHEESGETIGTYERLVECGGPSRQTQAILVFVHPSR